MPERWVSGVGVVCDGPPHGPNCEHQNVKRPSAPEAKEADR